MQTTAAETVQVPEDEAERTTPVDGDRPVKITLVATAGPALVTVAV